VRLERTRMSANTNRPLSPHLQVYRLPLLAIMSVLHRMTGVALSIGGLLIAWWLVALSISEEAYNVARDFAASPLGLFMIFGWTVALYYHLFNGIRHLIWDTARMLSLRGAYRSGYAVLLFTVLATGATWFCAYTNDSAVNERIEAFVNPEAVP
jgi:succinate dehydrogenase / fumarate reductase cytochrome b subunit